MKDLKQILFVILELAVLIGLVVGCCYSSVFRWITLILVIVLAIVFVCLDLNRDKYGDSHSPENIWGKDWKKLVDEGKLSTTKPYKCRKNRLYSNKKKIEKLSEINIPAFKVLNCEETLPTQAGDYSGFMDIEFKKDILELTIQKIKSIPSSKWSYLGGTRYRCMLSDGYFCRWYIELEMDSRKAHIEYIIHDK